jgi:hypothetical protein
MAIDNTHTKYLKGADKKTWKNYKEALDSQKQLDKFFNGLNAPELEDGEEFDVPIKK